MNCMARLDPIHDDSKKCSSYLWQIQQLCLTRRDARATCMEGA